MFRALQAWNSRPARASSPLACRFGISGSCWPAAREFSVGDLVRRPSQPARRRSRRPDRRRPGQGRPHPAAVGAPATRRSAAQSMRNAAEMALAEFNNPDIQLLVKDDGGTAPGAQQAAQQALDEGAEIILGPLFALTVGPVGQLARAAQRPGDRVLDRHQCRRARRLSAELPAGIRRRPHRRLRRQPGQTLVRRAHPGQRLRHRGRGRLQAGGRAPRRPRRRARALSRSTRRRCRARSHRRAGGEPRADAIFIPDGADAVPTVVQTLIANGIDTKRVQLLGTGLWEDRADLLQSAARRRLVCRPDSTGFRNFSGRYRSRYGQDPVRTASLAYDAVALVAALVKTQGAQRFSEEVLTNRLGLHRHRRAVPLPSRRHQPARACGDAGDADRRPDHQPAAQGVRRVGDVAAKALDQIEPKAAPSFAVIPGPPISGLPEIGSRCPSWVNRLGCVAREPGIHSHRSRL